MNWVNATTQGILLGGLYALFAAGLSLTFGVMRVVNLAHGDLALLATYLALVIVDSTGINPLLTVILVVPSDRMNRTPLEPVRTEPPSTSPPSRTRCPTAAGPSDSSSVGVL